MKTFSSSLISAKALITSIATLAVLMLLSTPMISLASANQIDLNSSVHLADKTQFISPSPSITDPTEKHNWTETEVLDLYTSFKNSGSFAEYPFTWDQIQYIIDNKIDVPVEYLTAEVMTAVVVCKQPDDYHMDESGLYWGPSGVSRYHTMVSRGWYRPTSWSRRYDQNGLHYIYWFPFCFSSYTATFMGIPLPLDKYACNGIMLYQPLAEKPIGGPAVAGSLLWVYIYN